MDKLSKQRRSWVMSRVKGKNTEPEKRVRLWLYRQGYRYRKNVSTLPGKPDIVFRKYRAVVDVRGCFWHRHANCKIATMPQSNSKFWWKKFNANMGRDIENERKLKALGWIVIVVWECELEAGFEKTMQRIVTVLERQRTHMAESRRAKQEGQKLPQKLRYDDLEDSCEMMMVAETD